MERSFLFFLLISMVLFFTVGCGGLSEKVKADFLKKNPNAEIISLYPGEGNFDAVEYHIKYKDTSSSEVKEVIWIYNKNDEGKWEILNNKD